jgi:Flp pilus assembly protein TadG
LHPRNALRDQGQERARAGQSLTELPIVLVLFLVVTFGIVDAGRLIFMYNAVSLAAREGVRYAVVRGSASGHAASADDITAYVQSKTVGQPVDVTETWCTAALACSSLPTSPFNDPGSSVAVTVHSTFTPVTPFVPGPFNLNSTSQMVISR